MYRVKFTPTAGLMFDSLHPTVKKQLKSILRELYKNPYLGKELREELIDFRSLIKRQLYTQLDTAGIFMK